MTRETLFLADLHLDPSRPAVMAQLSALLAGRARGAEALYLLGDLFEAWIGDDDDTPDYRRVEGALHELAASGVAIYFMGGNRDFLAGPAFAARSGCRPIPDPTVIDLYGVPTLLCHGDTLCTGDRGYQALRARLRDPAWQADFLARPVAERRTLAAGLRDASRAETAGKSAAAMDVDPTAVAAALTAAGAARLIHGHTHRPGVARVPLPGGGEALRLTLPAWDATPGMAVCTPQGCRLEMLGNG